MPITPHYHGPPGAALLTQVGPRDRAWLDAVNAIRAPASICSHGGNPAATPRTGSGAMVHLWLDVRYRQAATDEETELGVELLERLRRAYRLDPTLSYPYTAWESSRTRASLAAGCVASSSLMARCVTVFRYPILV